MIGSSICNQHSPRTVNMSNRMAGHAGDPRLRGRMLLEIKVWIIEGAAEERHRIMTARAPPRGLDVAIPREGTCRVSFR